MRTLGEGEAFVLKNLAADLIPAISPFAFSPSRMYSLTVRRSPLEPKITIVSWRFLASNLNKPLPWQPNVLLFQPVCRFYFWGQFHGHCFLSENQGY